MQTNSMFFVIDFGFKSNNLMRVCGAFEDYASALSHANNLKKQYRDVKSRYHSSINDDWQ